jgi:hypothetical protein
LNDIGGVCGFGRDHRTPAGQGLKINQREAFFNGRKAEDICFGIDCGKTATLCWSFDDDFISFRVTQVVFKSLLNGPNKVKLGLAFEGRIGTKLVFCILVSIVTN